MSHGIISRISRRRAYRLLCESARSPSRGNIRILCFPDTCVEMSQLLCALLCVYYDPRCREPFIKWLICCYDESVFVRNCVPMNFHMAEIHTSENNTIYKKENCCRIPHTKSLQLARKNYYFLYALVESTSFRHCFRYRKIFDTFNHYQ